MKRIEFTFKSGVQVVHDFASFTYTRNERGGRHLDWESMEGDRMYNIEVSEVVMIREVR